MRQNDRIQKGVTAALVIVVGVALGFGSERAASPPPAPALWPTATSAFTAEMKMASPVPGLELEDPSALGLNPARLAEAEDAIRREVRRGAFPGAALVIGRGAQVAVARGIGSPDRTDREVDPDSTVYDLASLTKVVATTTAVMLLVEDVRWIWTRPCRATSPPSPREPSAGSRCAIYSPTPRGFRLVRA